jgi:LPPG:FO 2-phospho-L-lactate transferase
MSDKPVATVIHSGSRRLEFQEYFVANRQQDQVDGVSFAGIEAARPTPEGGVALATAGAIVFCPSNPIVSIAPILAVPGVREALATSSARRVAISPIVGGKALKGPADRMLVSLGHEASALGIARLYEGLIDVLVIDLEDEALAPAIARLDIEPVVLQTVMGGQADRERLAREVLARAIPAGSRA